jgi:uncharacterized protein (TIGR02145 family)
LEKHAEAQDSIDDVIAVTKDGYLDFRMEVTNPDTNGIEIKMIVNASNVTDQDGNVYQSVKIGNQIWTTENLRVTKYNDSTEIPFDTSTVTWNRATTPKYCYYENVASIDSIIKYGALYNWYVVETKKLAPAGWHVPDTTEWNELENFLIANGYNWDGTTDSSKIAKSLAAKTNWQTYTGTGTIGCDLTKNNSSGFSALPGGYRDGYGSFYGQSSKGYWWSANWYGATEEYDEAGSRDLDYRSEHLTRYYSGVDTLYYVSGKGCGLSVRLVKDN